MYNNNYVYVSFPSTSGQVYRIIDYRLN